MRLCSDVHLQGASASLATADASQGLCPCRAVSRLDPPDPAVLMSTVRGLLGAGSRFETGEGKDLGQPTDLEHALHRARARDDHQARSLLSASIVGVDQDVNATGVDEAQPAEIEH